MAGVLLGAITPYPSNLITDANQALAIQPQVDAQPAPKKDESQYNSWSSLRLFRQIPTYALLAGGVAGIVIIVVATRGNNNLGIAGGALLTAASLGGAYYCFRYTKMKPLVELIGQLTQKVHEIDKVRQELQTTLDGYQKLEKKLKGDNDTLASEVKAEENSTAAQKKQFDDQAAEIVKLTAQIQDTAKQLANYKALCDTLKGQLASLGQLVTSFNQVSAAISANAAAINQGAGSVAASETKLQTDSLKLADDNKEFDQITKQFDVMLDTLKKDIGVLQDSFKTVKDELARQKDLIAKLESHVDVMATATSHEAQNAGDLTKSADKVEAQLAQLQELLKQLK